ncbi:hypothetical protein EVAR_85490_1 [Eumeta japonica]|uniref:Uncharacterized protein n=1 Tax=Eumeta variegata TaxID=151549 RepID=A0A4C1VC94_EUMVA|nr:hypothetical protein EVAR_85490_1 [Eumeta japonica]
MKYTGKFHRNYEETETSENLRVQGQGYMVDALPLPKQTLSIFAEWLRRVWYGVIVVKNYTLSIDQFWPFFPYFLLESRQLLAVEMRIARRLGPVASRGRGKELGNSVNREFRFDNETNCNSCNIISP